MAYNTTDAQQVDEIIYHSLENGNADAAGTLITSMFTLQQILDALNDRQRRFLLDTGLIQKRVVIPGVPQQMTYDLPSDWIDTRRVTWGPGPQLNFDLEDANGVVWRVSVNSIGLLTTTSVASGNPVLKYYRQSDNPNLAVQLIVDITGLLQTVSIAPDPSYPLRDLLGSFDNVWEIRVITKVDPYTGTSADGILQTAQVPVGVGGPCLTRVDGFELDNGLDNWATDFATPTMFFERFPDTLNIDIVKAPNDVGQIGLLYVYLSQLLDGSGVTLIIPDEWAVYVKWGALADLLGADGQANDPQRAAYASMRYDQGVELAKIVMGGMTSATV